MAAVTPYEQVDYQQLSAFRPYELPINDIFKGLVAQNQYWDEGAYRVKSVYENALNLSLSKEPNKQIRDKFLKDSEEQLAKLSTMNLANASVQRMGIDIYKPLLQDKGIISDHAATEHIKKINADAERARTQDHGKYYSQYNHQYALQGAKEFMDSGDRNAGEAYLKQARNYEAFYDYTSEYEKVSKLCPADKNSSNLPFYGSSGKDITGYFVNTEIKERTASKAYNCLLSNLSGPAIRQLQIEGSVTYRSVPIKDFGEEIVASYNDQINLYNKKTQEIATSMQSLNSKNNKMTLEERKQAATQYAKDLSEITKNVTEITAKRDKLIAGDFTDVYENFDSHAGNMYVHKKLWKEAVSLAFREYTRDFSGDPVQLQSLRQKFESAMQSARFQHAEQMQDNAQRFQLKLESIRQFFKTPLNNSLYKLNEDGSISLNPNQQFLDPSLFSKPPETPGSEVFNKLKTDIDQANSDLINLNKGLFNSMITKATNEADFRKNLLTAYGYTDFSEASLNKFAKQVRDNNLMIGDKQFQNTTFVQGYLANFGDDLEVRNYKKTYAQATSKLKETENTLQLKEQEVAENLGYSNIDDFINKNLSDKGFTKNTKLGDFEFTPSEMYRLSQGQEVVKKGNKFSISKGLEEVSPEFMITPFIEPLTATSYSINMNGKPVKWSDNTKNFIQNTTDIIDAMETPSEQINSARDRVYKNSNWNNKKYISVYDNESPFIEAIQYKFGDEGQRNKSISVSAITGDGEVIISGVGAGNQSTLSAMGIGAVTELDNGYYSIQNTGYGVIPQAINSPYARSAAGAIMSIQGTKKFRDTEIGNIVDRHYLPIWSNGEMINATLSVVKLGENDARYDLYKTDVNKPIDRPLISAPNALSFMNSYMQYVENVY
jgi:hypothetical protein